MAPPKFQDSDITKGMINSPRPSPLRVTKDSHLIQKPLSSSSSSSSHQTVIEHSSHASGIKHHNQSSSTGKRQPVIIYTHSPKVIHTQARDFMALVQKLTGLTRSDKDKVESSKDSEEKDCDKNTPGSEENESCSVLMTTTEIKQDPSVISSIYKSSSPYLIDPSLFDSNSSELFYSSRSNSLFQTPSMENSLSPTLMEYMRGYPEY